MSTEGTKTIVRRIFDEAGSRGQFGIIDTAVADNFRYTTSALPEYLGPAGFKRFFSEHRSAFPDLHYDLHELVAEGDNVVLHWTAHGTHRGMLAGIPATGKQIAASGISIFHFAGGKVDAGQTVWDALATMQQLGVIPAPG